MQQLSLCMWKCFSVMHLLWQGAHIWLDFPPFASPSLLFCNCALKISCQRVVSVQQCCLLKSPRSLSEIQVSESSVLFFLSYIISLRKGSLRWAFILLVLKLAQMIRFRFAEPLLQLIGSYGGFYWEMFHWCETDFRMSFKCFHWGSQRTDALVFLLSFQQQKHIYASY